MAVYSWLTLTEAITALQGRLNAGLFWSPAELEIYLTEALMLRNALCEEWKEDFVFPASGCQWQSIGSLAGSPRLRTVTDVALYIQMQYMLLEVPSGGGSWSGTNQFTLQKLQYALSDRRNEVIQAVACNMVNLGPIVKGTSTRTTVLPDTVLESRRVRFLALILTANGTCGSGATVITVTSTVGLTIGMVVIGSGVAYGASVVSVGTGTITISIPTTAALSMTQLKIYMPITLTREDTQAFQNFNPNYLQETGIPQSWSVVSEAPLSFDTDQALVLPGIMDVIALQSGPVFAPPSATLLGIPDDWSWLPMYGALADILGEEAESTDRQRAAYCLKRYTDGLEMFKQSNWMLEATVNGVAIATPALANKDWYLPEWETVQDQIPCIVQDGIDFVAVAPGAPSSASLKLVQNAPVLDPTGTYVQVTRDSWDSVLNYAHHLAAFKMGGNEFAETMPMLDAFFEKCQQDNKRVATYGLYVDQLYSAGKEQDVEEPR
jgi:hypothetical protein